MFGFGNIFGGRKEEATEEVMDPSERANEIVLALIQGIGKDKDRQKEAGGAKVTASDLYRGLFLEGVDLLKDQSLEPIMRSSLQEYMDEMKTIYSNLE